MSSGPGQSIIEFEYPDNFHKGYSTTVWSVSEIITKKLCDKIGDHKGEFISELEKKFDSNCSFIKVKLSDMGYKVKIKTKD